MTNAQRIAAIFAKCDAEFSRKWRASKGLAGTSKDKRQFATHVNGKEYLIVEREHRGASGKFRSVSVHVYNPETRDLDFVKHVDGPGAYERAKLSPEKQ